MERRLCRKLVESRVGYTTLPVFTELRVEGQVHELALDMVVAIFFHTMEYRHIVIDGLRVLKDWRR